MKKIIPIILLAFIIPQIALAAWWNPLSWFNNWGFSKVDTKTQIIENAASSTTGHSLLSISNATTTPTTSAQKASSGRFLDNVIMPKKVEPNTKATPVQAPAPAPVSVDKYGMTDSYWANEIAGIPAARNLISSNEGSITKKQGFIADLDDSIKTVSSTMTSGSPLDSTGRQYAQNYINLAQSLEAGYKKENDLTSSIDTTLSQVITATYNHDKSSVDALTINFKSYADQLKTLTDQDTAIFTQQATAFSTFSNYYILFAKTYTPTTVAAPLCPNGTTLASNCTTYPNGGTPTPVPTYTPTYVPQPQQYNTNCTLNSYYGGGGGTASCTTYSPSSAAISACASILTTPGGTEDFMQKQYARCLQDHSI